MDPRAPMAEAVAIRGERVLAVGAAQEMRELAGPRTEIVDAAGALVIPAFHDAHMHLLSYARRRARLDCSELTNIAALRTAIAARAYQKPAGAWLRAARYDSDALSDGREPDRHDLDAAAPNHPVQLRHRSLHLDVLNSLALRLTGLWDERATSVERDPSTGEPTGRLYGARELLSRRLPHPTEAELAVDVARACDELLAWGTTSITNASVTNGRDEWELMRRLQASGHLRVRVYFMTGLDHWREIEYASAPTSLVRRGPVKVMLDEGTSRTEDLAPRIAEVRRAGYAVAVHAITEAEIAMALEIFRGLRPRTSGPPDRLEHAAVLPDELLREVSALGLAVAGQPGLVLDRGDRYREAFAPELHPWLHRGRSLVAAGIPYAIGSDAPVTSPAPRVALRAAMTRVTRSGAVLGPDERLTLEETLEAMTHGPARLVGAGDLGSIRPGAIADIAVHGQLEPRAPAEVSADSRPAHLVISGGAIVAPGRPRRD